MQSQSVQVAMGGALLLLVGYASYSMGGRHRSTDGRLAGLEDHGRGTGWTPPQVASDTSQYPPPAPPAPPFRGSIEVALGLGITGEFLTAGLRPDAEGVQWVNFTELELRQLLSLPSPFVPHADDIATQVHSIASF